MNTYDYSVAVIGAGNCGCALAGHIKSLGVDVRLYADPKHNKNFAWIKDKGGILSEGVVCHKTSMPKLTTDIMEAVRGVKYIFFALPSYAQDKVFSSLLPCLQDGQVIVVISGNFSSLSFRNIMRETGITPKIVLIETSVSPYACRVDKEGCYVDILAIKKRIKLAGYNLMEHSKINQELSSLMPCGFTVCENILEIGMGALNGIIHPAAALLNTGWVESTAGNFYFYKNGVSASIGKLMDRLDQERQMIGRAYGLNLQSFISTIADFYVDKYDDIASFAKKSIIHNKLKAAPSTLKHRYIVEDVPFLLVPWYSFAKNAGLETPILYSIIGIASSLLGVDYLATGRTLATMGLEGFSVSDINKYVLN